VFVKVFDESRGYYGNQGHVARFERDLDTRDQYEAFKEAFERIAWDPVEPGPRAERAGGRQHRPCVRRDQRQATDGIIKQYQQSYAVSIEDFADEVKAWLDKQPDGFRLNFYVDEVGQFIGSNTHLMLNLQTIAESLNTKCGGRAWVFVTSQEDMDKVVGDRTKQQGNDFSKIQARFKTRVNLTSADVEEVIRKRLLEKNDAGARTPSDLRHRVGELQDTVRLRRRREEVPQLHRREHFVGTYPFVSYQFPLFQAAIEGISDHNAFEGRNSSVGERSMLGVVQEVAKDIGTARSERWPPSTACSKASAPR
jgi:hypothetical protein